MKKTITILLIATIYIGTLIMAMIVSLVDCKKMEDLHEDSYAGYYKEKKQCQMPGCNNFESYLIVKRVQTQYRRHANLNLPNKANFVIETGKTEHVTTKEITHKDKYFSIQPQADGSFRASIEEDRYSYDVEDKKFTHFFTEAYGYYCAQHENEAEEIIIGEFETAIKSKWVYVWGKTLFPVNLIIVTWVIAFVLALCSDGTFKMDSPWGPIIVTAVFCALATLCHRIKDDVIGPTLFFTCLFGVAGFGAIPFAMLGSKIARIRSE
ncbi:MAG: hypothetical protein J6Q30_07660 [Oscillospiraceae bacterium]|nr:hypothetical protein [Oscillospiraceae bacterium]